MTNNLNLLLAQTNPLVGAIEANAEQIISIIESQQETQQIILFPELSLTGYPPEDLLFRPEFRRQCEQALQAIGPKVGNSWAIIGHPHWQNNHCYNAASVFYRGERIGLYFKQNLPNHGVFDEHRYFKAGDPVPLILEIDGRKMAVIICEDLWQPGPVERAVEAGATQLLCLNASPFDTDKFARRQALLEYRARQGLDIFYVNQVGGQDELLFDGGSLAMNAQGEIKAQAPFFTEALLSVSLGSQGLQGECCPLPEPIAMLYDALVFGTREYVNKNRFPGVLLGLSGGIDSALVLAIAVDALGADRVLAVMMPSRYSADISLTDALTQVKTLGVRYEQISIEPAFNALLNSLSPLWPNQPMDSTEENIQARIRGLILMALSNKSGAMVLTTSNKSETAVGYSTLYGDMAGGFAPIKDVLKTLVYELARYRNQISPVIPDRVLTRAPSAELRPDQTDQDSLPDYAVLDALIKGHMEDNQDAPQLIAAGHDPQTVQRVLQLIKRNEYKRRQSAPGLKVTPRAFGKDWRYPITKA